MHNRSLFRKASGCEFAASRAIWSWSRHWPTSVSQRRQRWKVKVLCTTNETRLELCQNASFLQGRARTVKDVNKTMYTCILSQSLWTINIIKTPSHRSFGAFAEHADTDCRTSKILLLSKFSNSNIIKRQLSTSSLFKRQIVFNSLTYYIRHHNIKIQITDSPIWKVVIDR